jgi:L-amino acid N-acyltransferase YncA
MIRHVKLSDSRCIAGIYNEYVLNSKITFEETALSEEEITARINNVTRDYPWLVYEENGNVLGYAYAVKWKERSAYRHTVEAGIYIDADHISKGIGTKLMVELIEQLQKKSVHSVIYGVALPNPASIALCEKLGFIKVAHFIETGLKFNEWIDVGYWQRLL